MKKIKLLIIPKPNPSSCAIIELKKGVKFNGQKGESMLVCGNCEEVLAEKIRDNQLLNFILRCNCGAYNRIPTTWEKFRFRDIKETWNWPIVILGILLIVISYVIPKYGNITFWLGLIITLASTALLFSPKKTIKIFSEDRD